MNTVKLDKDQIVAKITQGDNYDGNFVLAVAQDGSEHRICFNSRPAAWNEWAEDWCVCDIPALNPDGSGQAVEDAEDMLKRILSVEEFETAKARYDEGKIGWVDLAEELRPDDWKSNREFCAGELADIFIGDLNTPDGADWPWGTDSDGDNYPAPDCEFEWA